MIRNFNDLKNALLLTFFKLPTLYTPDIGQIKFPSYLKPLALSLVKFLGFLEPSSYLRFCPFRLQG